MTLIADMPAHKIELSKLANTILCETVVCKQCFDDGGTIKDVVYKKSTDQLFKVETDESLIEIIL